MTEQTPFNTTSKKGIARATIAKMLLGEIEKGTLQGMICRAPEFYGPDNTQSGTNATIFDNIKAGKKAQVLISDSTLRTLIYTPDAGKATALLGNTPDAYNQTWHLPCDTNRLTTKEFIALCSEVKGKEVKYSVLSPFMVRIGGFFNPFVKEIIELLYQWKQDYVFDTTKFNTRFPDFKTTPLKEGIRHILQEK